MCSPSVVHNIVKETTIAIWEVMKTEVFSDMTVYLFKTTADGFEGRWNFPNCIGAIDGKHIFAQKWICFFNYKKSHSIVLLAMDYNYNFIMYDIGAAGRQSDEGFLANSTFGKKNGPAENTVSSTIGFVCYHIYKIIIYLLLMMYSP